MRDEGSEINHGIHRNTRKRESESTSPFRVLPASAGVFRGYAFVMIFLAGVIPFLLEVMGGIRLGARGRIRTHSGVGVRFARPTEEGPASSSLIIRSISR